jgi:hypothetical protein
MYAHSLICISYWTYEIEYCSLFLSFQQKDKTFDFRKEFQDYCISDMDILRRCCAQFKSTLYALVHVNPFQESIMFASMVNLAYRRGVMPFDTIVIVHNMVYQPPRRYSVKG